MIERQPVKYSGRALCQNDLFISRATFHNVGMSAAIESQAAVDLEYAINEQALRLATLETIEGRRAANEELCRLVKLRTPERIQEMEEEKGLLR